MPERESLRIALSQPDRDRRVRAIFDALSASRRPGFRIDDAETSALLDAQFDEAARDPFDRDVYAAIWSLFRFGTRNAQLKDVAFMKLDNPRSMSRGDAMACLLASHPESRDDLTERYRNDSDPYVQDALAAHFVGTDPARALVHWEKVLDSRPLPHDLAETVPVAVAPLLDEPRIRLYEEWDRRSGGGSVWGLAAAAARRRSSGAPAT